jgi:hypothetical protein
MAGYEDFLEAPPGEAKLWRYMDLPKFLSLIATSELFLPSVSVLRAMDPYGGVWPEAEIEYRRDFETRFLDESEKYAPIEPELRRKLENDQKAAFRLRVEDEQFEAEFTYVSCWHEREDESHAMWKIYGGVQGAIAVQTTFARLRDAIQSGFDRRCQGEPANCPEPVLGRVKYIDFRNARIPSYSYALYLHKRKAFESEREVRAIVQAIPYVASEKGTHHFPGLTPSTYALHKSASIRSGMRLPMRLPELIESVHVSPLAPDWIVKPVVEVVKRFDLPDIAERLTRSSLLNMPAYLLDPERTDSRGT